MPTCNKYELPISVKCYIKGHTGKLQTLDLKATEEYRTHKSIAILSLDMNDRDLLWTIVRVLSKKMRKQRTDLKKDPFQPSIWVFTCKKIP